MMTKIPALRLCSIVLCWFGVQQATACPYCNVHHRLAESVRISEDIYLGKVTQVTGGWNAEIQVLEVLRGTHKVGSTVTRRMLWEKPSAGREFVLCERDSSIVDFGELAADTEDEVLFLMQGRPFPAPRDMDEAIRRLRGVSVESAQAGMGYVAAHHAEAVKPLLAEIHSLVPAELSTAEQFSVEYPLARFVEALLLEPTDEGRDFVFAQIDRFPSQPASPDDWDISPLLVPKAIGSSLLLAVLLWFGTRSFLRWRFPQSLWSLPVLVATTSLLLWWAISYSWWLYDWDVWLLFIPGIVGMSISLVGAVWFGTRLLLQRPFPRTLWSLLLAVGATSILLGCAVWYAPRLFLWIPRYHSLVPVFGTSVVLVTCLGLGSRVVLRRPFPSSLWSGLMVVSVTAGLAVYTAWCAYPVPRRISADGIFLRDVLRSSMKDPKFAAQVRERLLARCETLQGLPLAEAVYAMSLSNIVAPAQIGKTKLRNQESADMLALGLYLAGNYHSAWWAPERARPFWDEATRLAQTRRLKRAIADRIAFEDRFGRRAR
jgi:hypothetical protein